MEEGSAASQEDDGALLAASAAGDARAFSAIVRRYQRPVYRLVWRMMNGHGETEDVTQEVFLRLWRNPSQVREPAALKAWLMRVASNSAIDRLRVKPHADLATAADSVADGSLAADSALQQRDLRSRVDRAIAELPERQRLALVLTYFEDMGNIEAARSMETTVEAVESLLGRAKRSLRQALQSERQDLSGLFGAEAQG